jgi:phage tail-like protein
MGILLTTTTKQDPTTDVFKNGKFAKTIVQEQVDTSKPAPAEDIPFPAYLCAVKFGDQPVGLFQAMTDIAISREVEAIKQGGENDFGRELPGGITYSHMTLKSGYSTSTLFFDWMLAGQEAARPIYKNIDVIQGWPDAKTKAVKMGRQWTFYHAYPVKWSISDFSVDDIEKILIETIEIAYDYFKVVNVP